MLCELSIRDIILIDRLDLSFDEGLTVLTGETGAGKSILLDSLGLALGARVDSAMRRQGASQATVTATFEIKNIHPIIKLLDDLGLKIDEIEGGILYLRRVIGEAGKSRAFINDHPVSARILKRVGDLLIEIQGQFDAHGLMDQSSHRTYLDMFAEHTNSLCILKEDYRKFADAKKVLNEARQEVLSNKSEEDYLKFSLKELDELSPLGDEESKLTEMRSLLMNAEKIIWSLNEAVNIISGENGAMSLVANAQKILDRINDKTTEDFGSLDRAAAELVESESVLTRLANNIEVDSGKLEEVENRLSDLRTAARKYSVTPNELTVMHVKLSDQLKAMKCGETSIELLEKKYLVARENFINKASHLSQSRAAAAKKLDEAIILELGPLKLDKTRFHTLLEVQDESQWGPEGFDRVNFEIATNPGMPLGPLSKIASGGELSRLLLALRVALSSIAPLPTLIFDEVDSGVGGAVAAAVGDRLNKLGNKLQVLVVTHSPQVAAKGNSHWKVMKVGNDVESKTTAFKLKKEDRIEEVARMLAGEVVTNEARAASLKLLES
jgi:DNA repair protein RecN (Recombination protein N)